MCQWDTKAPAWTHCMSEKHLRTGRGIHTGHTDKDPLLSLEAFRLDVSNQYPLPNLSFEITFDYELNEVVVLNSYSDTLIIGNQLFTVKTVKNGDSKIDKTEILMTNGSLMKIESIAECSPWSILEYFWPALKR